MVGGFGGQNACGAEDLNSVSVGLWFTEKEQNKGSTLNARGQFDFIIDHIMFQNKIRLTPLAHNFK